METGNVRHVATAEDMIPESAFDSSANAAKAGTKDIQSVFFVNVSPRRDGRSPDHQRQLDEAKACIDLHNQYLALGIVERFTEQVKSGKLPTSGATQDQVARSKYKATSTASWLTQISGCLRQIRTSASSTFEFDLTAVRLPAKNLDVTIVITLIAARGDGFHTSGRLITLRTEDHLVEYVSKKETAKVADFALEYFQGDALFDMNMFRTMKVELSKTVKQEAKRPVVNQYDVIV
ncbi:hypothetical protein CBER1_03805 [Cercospora berteroae]|uniref:Uncharacterized protein n=1 Tax=Cercospora berteroae TaxID=357750 RepID=A0A2S6C836_9PEZI|nr:hypothetical protein CBER1_03805 [Cercospora berteroae]